MNIVSTDQKIIKARMTTDGEGASIKRVFPGPSFKHHDPFVLLDEFFVEPETGFPEHPHQGFEAITYMLEGTFRHKDNIGNDSTVAAGGLQRFSAGQEIRHSEMPGSEDLNHGLQLWINLPSNLKNLPPEYQQVEPEDVPTKTENGITTKTLVGPDSPLETHSNIIYQDVILGENVDYIKNIPENWNAILYLLDNSVNYNENLIFPGEAVILDSISEIKLETIETTRFVLIAGQPYNEIIRQRGSIVL